MLVSAGASIGGTTQRTKAGKDEPTDRKGSHEESSSPPTEKQAFDHAGEPVGMQLPMI
jgi:hypothetical protein